MWESEASIAKESWAVGEGWWSETAEARMDLAAWKAVSMAGVQEKGMDWEQMSVRGRRTLAMHGRKRRCKLSMPKNLCREERSVGGGKVRTG